MIVPISTENAPAAVGPYSQAVKSGDTIYCSGQVPLNPNTGELVLGSIADQTTQVMDNLKNVLEAAGSDFAHALKINIYITDLATFGEVNKVYSSYFDNYYPARLTVEVSKLYGGCGVEIDVVAVAK